VTTTGAEHLDDTHPLDGRRDPAAILDNLDRIQRAIGDDPAQAVGSAKELIQSTAKTVLLERGQTVIEKGTVRTTVVRHEALLVRVEVGDLRRPVVVAAG